MRIRATSLAGFEAALYLHCFSFAIYLFISDFAAYEGPERLY